MAAILGRTEVGVREFGRTVTIPEDPKARLMYYLDCICVVLDMSDTANLSRLRYLRRKIKVSTLCKFLFVTDTLKNNFVLNW